MTTPFHQSTMTMSYRRLISGFFLLILLAFGAFSATSTQAQAAAAQAETTPTALAADASGGPAAPASTTEQAALEPLIFSDDFEAYGDSSLWTSESPFTVQSRIVANGSYAARMTNNGGVPMFGRKTLDQVYARLYVRLRFQVINIEGEPVTLLNLRPIPSESLVAIRINPDGAVSFETGATSIVATSSVIANHGAWNELMVMVDSASEQKSVQIWLNGAELTGMRQDVWLGGNGIRSLDLGDNTAGLQSDVVVDDIIVDDAFIPSTRAADPVSGTLVVRAVPPLPGIEFELDGKTFTSSSDGVARIDVARWSADLRSRIVVHDVTRKDGAHASFANWENWSQSRSREVNATFTISERVTFSFVDSAGAPVDSATIDSLIIKSNSGVILTIPGAELAKPVLVTASTYENTSTGFQTKPTVYVVDEVLIDGANVVNSSQQRATVDTNYHWQISLLFYGVKLRAHDAFFGLPLGIELLVESADGTQQRHALDDDGSVVLSRVPRVSIITA